MTYKTFHAFTEGGAQMTHCGLFHHDVRTLNATNKTSHKRDKCKVDLSSKMYGKLSHLHHIFTTLKTYVLTHTPLVVVWLHYSEKENQTLFSLLKHILLYSEIIFPRSTK